MRIWHERPRRAFALGPVLGGLLLTSCSAVGGNPGVQPTATVDTSVPGSSGTSTSDGPTVPFAQSESEWLAALEAQANALSELARESVEDRPIDAVVRVGESIQEVVDAMPEGATIVIATGVHTRQEVRPKSGMFFLGQEGAVLDGEGTSKFAFSTWLPSPALDVTIRSLEIRNYGAEPPQGAIHAPDASGWIIADCEVHHNGGAGVYVAGGSVVRGCSIHHNERIGIKAKGRGILVEDNEIWANNPNDANDPQWEAGGFKFGFSDGVVVRNNKVYENHGHGIWADVGAIHTLYEGNEVADNVWSGIHHEISYNAVIRGNVLRGNGFGDNRPDPWGAGIQIRGPFVEVVGNVLEGNKNGIALIQTDRGSGDHGSFDLREIWVHDNSLTESGVSGTVVFSGGVAVFDTSLFDLNSYVYQDPGAWWIWDTGALQWDQWRLEGNDLSGLFESG